jgi:hypothetical protein
LYVSGSVKRRCCCDIPPPDPRCGSCRDTFHNRPCSTVLVVASGITTPCCFNTIRPGHWVDSNVTSFDLTFSATQNTTLVCVWSRVFTLSEFFFRDWGTAACGTSGVTPDTFGEQMNIRVISDGTSSTGFSLSVDSVIFNGKTEFSLGDCFGTYIVHNANTTCYTGGTVTVTLCT